MPHIIINYKLPTYREIPQVRHQKFIDANRIIVIANLNIYSITRNIC